MSHKFNEHNRGVQNELALVENEYLLVLGLVRGGGLGGRAGGLSCFRAAGWGWLLGLGGVSPFPTHSEYWAPPPHPPQEQAT